MSDLLQLQFTFSRLLPRLLDKAYSLGLSVTVGEAYRTPQQAKLNADAGSGIVNSLHTQRLAIDLQLFRDSIYLMDTKDYESLGEYWEQLGVQEKVPLAWGGRFSKPDGNHFSLGFQGVR